MRGIGKRFGATVALKDVGLRVMPGEVLALVGENGAGKSTLMKILSGAHQPDAGEMWLDGQRFEPSDPLEARRAGVAMIYQELSLAPHLTVEENIMLGMEPCQWGIIKKTEVRQRVEEAIRTFDHPEIRADAQVSRLSVAAQQMVEIARALAIGCRVLVLDEPTSSLTAVDVGQLFSLIDRLKHQGLGIVYISHFLEEIKHVADRVIVLRDGCVVGVGDSAALAIDQIIGLMVGRKVENLYPRSQRTPGDVVLEINELAGRERPVSAELALRRGEVLGIAGLLGAGRTELLRCIFGLDPVVRGRVKVGAWISPVSPARRWAQSVGLLSEDRKQEGLALGLSISDNVTLTRLTGFGPFNLVLPARQDAATQQWIHRLDLRCQGPRQQVLALSGGNQQKVALARLLQHGVDVLLLDEPTRGIDVAAKAAVYQLIDDLATGAGGKSPKAVLMVSSYLPELLGICDRISVMCRGVLRPARAVSTLNEHALMAEATGQLNAPSDTVERL